MRSAPGSSRSPGAFARDFSPDVSYTHGMNKEQEAVPVPVSWRIEAAGQVVTFVRTDANNETLDDEPTYRVQPGINVVGFEAAADASYNFCLDLAEYRKAEAVLAEIADRVYPVPSEMRAIPRQ